MAYKETKIDVRVFLSPDEHEYLKAIAKENGISMTELLRTCALKNYKYKQIRTKKKTPVSSKIPTTEEMERRLTEINEILNKAYNGEKLPHNEYTALKEEQTKLRSILNHN